MQAWQHLCPHVTYSDHHYGIIVTLGIETSLAEMIVILLTDLNTCIMKDAFRNAYVQDLPLSLRLHLTDCCCVRMAEQRIMANNVIRTTNPLQG